MKKKILVLCSLIMIALVVLPLVKQSHMVTVALDRNCNPAQRVESRTLKNNNRNMPLSQNIIASDEESIDGVPSDAVIIYDEENNFLFVNTGVVVGDFYMTKDYKRYEVIYINPQTHIGVARFIEQIERPKVTMSRNARLSLPQRRKIGLYSTHNAESFVPSDGTHSIWGRGGIHDVGNHLKNVLQNMGITTIYDESLHLPHDNLAYSRSAPTARRLLNQGVDAIFDVHRDGIPRHWYAVRVNGQERSRVRIVVGRGNANHRRNEEFALYLKAITDELYPWLILDIFYGTGHFNQNLSEKSLLLEMGTYMIEKELVMQSCEPLAHAINVTLYNTTLDCETGELEIGGTPSEDRPILNDIFQTHNEGGNAAAIIIWTILSLAALGAIGFGVTQFILIRKKKNSLKQEEK